MSTPAKKNQAKGKAEADFGKASNVSVKIYRVKTRSYESSQVGITHGKRRLRSFASEQKARDEAGRIAVNVASLDAGFLKLSGQDQSSYVRAMELLKPTSVPLELVAAQFAEAHKRREGRSLTAAVDFFMKRDAIRRLADRAGVKWKRHALRHSFISYRVAETQNLPQVSLEAGNSVTMVNKHSRELVMPMNPKCGSGLHRKLWRNLKQNSRRRRRTRLCSCRNEWRREEWRNISAESPVLFSVEMYINSPNRRHYQKMLGFQTSVNMIPQTNPKSLMSKPQLVSAKTAFTNLLVKPTTRWILSAAAAIILLSPDPAGAATLLWQGGAAPGPNVWDFTVTNWFDTDGLQQSVFSDGSVAIFDDTATTGQITLPSNVSATMTFSNATLPYVLSGAGVLSGTLTQEGEGLVTLAMDNAPQLSSIVNDAGTLLLDFPVGGSTTLAADISSIANSPGRLIQSGSNTVALTGYNLDYSGTIVVTNGVLQYDTAASLGAASSTLYVTNNGSLDLNHIWAGNKPIAISGAGYEGRGALWQSSTDTGVLTAVSTLVFLGDATLGGTGRWNASGTVQGDGYKITKVGTGQVWLYANTGDTGIGDIEVKEGTFGCYGSLLGDPAKTITVQQGATMVLWEQPDPTLDKKLVLNGAKLQSGFTPTGGNNIFVGPITLNLTNTIQTTSGHLHLFNSLSGSGGFTKIGASTLYVDGTNTYTGSTIINVGKVVLGAQASLASKLIQVASGTTLDIAAPPAFTLGSGQVLSGAGTVAGGNVVIGSGATLQTSANDTTVATLTISGSLVFQSGGTNRVVVNKTSSVTNNRVTGLASVQIGGTLAVVNIGNALAAGDIMTLFTAGLISGSGFESITPATPGPGLAWDTSTLLTDGNLRVMVSASPAPATLVAQVSNNQVMFSWPGGVGWVLQGQTNAPGIGLGTNWVDVQGSSTNAAMSFPINPTAGSVFYRLIYR